MSSFAMRTPGTTRRRTRPLLAHVNLTTSSLAPTGETTACPQNLARLPANRARRALALAGLFAVLWLVGTQVGCLLGRPAWPRKLGATAVPRPSTRPPGF